GRHRPIHEGRLRCFRTTVAFLGPQVRVRRAVTSAEKQEPPGVVAPAARLSSSRVDWPVQPSLDLAQGKMASAISSAGGRFRPLPTTSDVLTRRSVDRRSTDEHGLRQFPLPRPDAVVPVPQDALRWTYRSPEPSRWADGQVSELSA